MLVISSKSYQSIGCFISASSLAENVSLSALFTLWMLFIVGEND